MTTHQATAPSQLNLPGQTFVADGPHDQTGMYVMHHAFRRDLTDMISAVRQTPTTEAQVWAALLDRWQRFAEILHHHHAIEDEWIFPVLVEHARAAGNHADLEILAAMDDEHAAIDPALEACQDGFAAMTQHPCEDHRHALDIRLTGVREALLGHLRHEETNALPLLQRTMSDQEFAASERAAAKGYPPRLIPFLVPWALDRLPAEARERLLRSAGAPYRVLAWLAQGRYARRDRIVFRYV